jgi:hypothetical protein
VACLSEDMAQVGIKNGTVSNEAEGCRVAGLGNELKDVGSRIPIFPCKTHVTTARTINYVVTFNEKWLIFIRLPGGTDNAPPFKIEGAMQLHSGDRMVSQPVEGPAIKFGKIKDCHHCGGSCLAKVPLHFDRLSSKSLT